MIYCTQIVILLTFLLLASPEAFSQTELYYDDGTAEIGMAWQTPSNGAAVRFTVTPPVQLTSARIFIMTSQQSTPLGILVLAANGPNSSPGDTLFGPVTFGWNETIFSWSEYQFPQPVQIGTSDFYVAYYQTIEGSLDAVPIIGQDQTEEFSNRSWELFDGEWTQLWEDESTGNVMIRAVIGDSTPVLATTWGQLKFWAISAKQEGGP